MGSRTHPRRGPALAIKAPVGRWSPVVPVPASLSSQERDGGRHLEAFAGGVRWWPWQGVFAGVAFAEAFAGDPGREPLQRPCQGAFAIDAPTATRTPSLAADGGDLAAALQTILETGDRDGLQGAIADAFPCCRLTLDTSQGNRCCPSVTRSLGPSSGTPPQEKAPGMAPGVVASRRVLMLKRVTEA